MPFAIVGAKFVLLLLAGPNAAQLGLHSYAVVMLVFAIGLMATFWWWRSADQAS